MGKYKRKFFDARYVPNERRRNLILGCILFWSILAAAAIRQWGFGAIEVKGESMRPTLYSGERFIVHRWIYFYRSPQRDEIVVIRSPQDGVLSVKRVIGLPGETVEITGGAVRIGGKPLEEPYLAAGTLTRPEAQRGNVWSLAPDQYFVLGDNRPASEDSRFFGALRRTDILGKVRNPNPLPHHRE